MWTWLVAFWRSANITNILIGVIVVGGLMFYADNSRLKAKLAKCQANTELLERYDALADRLADELEIDRDAAIERIENSTDACLDRSVDKLLNP